MKYLDIIYDTPNQYSDAYLNALQKSCPDDIEIRVADNIAKWVVELKPTSSGVLVMMPTKYADHTLSAAIPDRLDIDAVCFGHTHYRPATATGIFNFINSYYEKKDTVILVIGRGKTVGRPLVDMCINYGYTVINTNSKTYKWDLNELLSTADIVVGASSESNILDDEDFKHIHPLLIDTGHNFDVYNIAVKKCGRWTRNIIFERVRAN